MTEITEGTLLGGRVKYRQFSSGHRSGFEPVLLAASVKARAGERVVEAGTGAGAALLCLAARVKGVIGTGVEINGDLADLANENFEINGLSEFYCIKADVASWHFEGKFDHAMANPPWHDEAGPASADAVRALAHQARPDLLARWITALTACLQPRGSLTLILPAAAFVAAAGILQTKKYGGLALLPLWPRTGQAAKMVIVQARLGSRATARVLPGLVLHDPAGITPAADTVLRDGEGLSF